MPAGKLMDMAQNYPKVLKQDDLLQIQNFATMKQMSSDFRTTLKIYRVNYAVA